MTSSGDDGDADDDRMAYEPLFASSQSKMCSFGNNDHFQTLWFSEFRIVSPLNNLANVHHVTRWREFAFDMVHCLHWTSFPLIYFLLWSFFLSLFSCVKCRRCWVYLFAALFPLCSIIEWYNLIDSFSSLCCAHYEQIYLCATRKQLSKAQLLFGLLRGSRPVDQPASQPARRYCLIQIENHTRCFHFMFSVLVHCGCLLLLSASMVKDNLITVRSLRTVVQNRRIFLFSRSHHLVRYNWIDREAAQRMSIQCGQSDPVGPQPTDSRTHNF